MFLEVAFDGGLKVDDAVEGAAPQSLPGEDREEAFDGIEPGGRGWSEVEGPPRMAIEPGFDLGMLVGAVIAHDRMDVLSGGDFAFDGVEKANELLMPVLLHAAADHRAVEDVEGCEQCRGPVPLVVVGHSAALAGLQREARLGTVERLDLGPLVD